MGSVWTALKIKHLSRTFQQWCRTHLDFSCKLVQACLKLSLLECLCKSWEILEIKLEFTLEAEVNGNTEVYHFICLCCQTFGVILCMKLLYYTSQTWKVSLTSSCRHGILIDFSPKLLLDHLWAHGAYWREENNKKIREKSNGTQVWNKILKETQSRIAPHNSECRSLNVELTIAAAVTKNLATKPLTNLEFKSKLSQ